MVGSLPLRLTAGHPVVELLQSIVFCAILVGAKSENSSAWKAVPERQCLKGSYGHRTKNFSLFINGHGVMGIICGLRNLLPDKWWLQLSRLVGGWWVTTPAGDVWLDRTKSSTIGTSSDTLSTNLNSILDTLKTDTADRSLVKLGEFGFAN